MIQSQLIPDPSATSLSKIAHLRATEKCDLRCKHCFAPPSSHVMTEPEICEMVDEVLSGMSPGDNLLVQWHGGEPTLLSPAMVERVIDHLSRTASSRDVTLRHGIQTNLTALHRSSIQHREAWFSLLKRRFDPCQIGVSFDYALRGEGAETIFDGMLRMMMSAHGLYPWVTLTLARPLFQQIMADPLAVLRRFGRVQGLRFEPLSRAGLAAQHWDEIGIDHRERGEALVRLLGAWWTRRHYLPDVSPLGEMMGAIQGNDAPSACIGRRRITMCEIDRDGVHGRCVALQGKGGLASVPLACLACPWREPCRHGCPALPFFQGGECRGQALLWSACHQILNEHTTHNMRIAK